MTSPHAAEIAHVTARSLFMRKPGARRRPAGTRGRRRARPRRTTATTLQPPLHTARIEHDAQGSGGASTHAAPAREVRDRARGRSRGRCRGRLVAGAKLQGATWPVAVTAARAPAASQPKTPKRARRPGSRAISSSTERNGTSAQSMRSVKAPVRAERLRERAQRAGEGAALGRREPLREVVEGRRAPGGLVAKELRLARAEGSQRARASRCRRGKLSRVSTTLTPTRTPAAARRSIARSAAPAPSKPRTPRVGLARRRRSSRSPARTRADARARASVRPRPLVVTTGVMPRARAASASSARSSRVVGSPPPKATVKTPASCIASRSVSSDSRGGSSPSGRASR